MIHLRLYFVLLFMLLLTSCVQKRAFEDNTNSEVENVSYKNVKNINSNITINIEVNTPVYNSSNKFFINEYIKLDLISFFGIDNIQFKNEKITEKSIDNFVIEYINNISDDYDDYDIDSLELYSNISYDLFYEIKDLKIIRKQTESYMGGAHGLYSTDYFVFDTKKRKKIELEEIFNIEKLTPLAYNYFLEQNGLNKKDTDIEKEGYSFKNNQFHLNENFSFNEKELLFLFNPYEIASYAQGQIIIRIPLTKLNNIIKKEYKYIINKD